MTAKYLFNGSCKLKVIDADNLQATDYSTRYSFQTSSSFTLSPYVHVDIDDVPMGRTSTKVRTSSPQFNEEFQLDVKQGHKINMTVFHDSALPPDEFVANCSIPLYEIKAKGQPIFTIELEPKGQLRFTLEFDGKFTQGNFSFSFILFLSNRSWASCFIRSFKTCVQKPAKRSSPKCSNRTIKHSTFVA